MRQKVKSSWGFWVLGLALLPLVAAGLFVVWVGVQSLFRYDQDYFSVGYQEKYDTPGSVALALELAIQTGDLSLVGELQGLRRAPQAFRPNPNIYTILMEVDQAGYFHYMYYDVKTFDREIHHIKEINDRWVYVPVDAYFYLDSGQWLKTFVPLGALYYAILVVAGLGVAVFRLGNRYRRSIYEY